MARLGARAGDAGWGCQAQGAGAVSVPWLWGPMTWLRSSDRLTLGQPSAGQLGQTLVVMLVMCCCPLELSGRRPQTRQHSRARSASRQARAIRPARKLALWAGTPVRARVGLAGRTRTRTRRTHAPRVVCMCSIRSFDPSLPPLGRPRVVTAAPNSSRLGQHRSCTRTRPLNVHTGQQ